MNVEKRTDLDASGGISVQVGPCGQRSRSAAPVQKLSAIHRPASSSSSTIEASPNVASNMTAKRDGERIVMRRPSSARDCATSPTARTHAVSMYSVSARSRTTAPSRIGDDSGEHVDEEREHGDVRVALYCDRCRVVRVGHRNDDARRAACRDPSANESRADEPGESHRHFPGRRDRCARALPGSGATLPDCATSHWRGPTRYGTDPRVVPKGTRITIELQDNVLLLTLLRRRHSIRARRTRPKR